MINVTVGGGVAWVSLQGAATRWPAKNLLHTS